jgi:divalent metal cation (Fe/Co/Zn/Cd) transporter
VILNEKSIAPDRPALVRRGLWLNYATIAYNSVEAIVSIVAGVLAGSVALVGFGVDSVIEVTASGAAQWRLRVDHDAVRRRRVERASVRVIGTCFIALALYVAYDGSVTLWRREHPERSIAGIAIAAASVVVMPVLARAKRRVAMQLASTTLESEAMQTSLCAYLSAIVLAGVTLNWLLGWWWADPVAALAMVPIIGREGVEAFRTDGACTDA